MQITLIAGLPGSGKTHLAQSLVSYPPHRVWLVDDIKDISQLVGVDHMQQIDHLIVTDPHFCRTSTRQSAEDLLGQRYKCPINWIFFENDPGQCEINVLYRNDGRQVRGMIHAMSKIYTVPAGADVRPVFKGHP